MQGSGIRRTWSDRGAAAVEFAVVLPALLLLILGTIDWGFHFFRREIVVNAAREGARTGSIADALLAEDAARARVAEYLAVAGLGDVSCTTTPVITAASARITVDCTGGPVTGFAGSMIPARIVAVAEMRR